MSEPQKIDDGGTAFHTNGEYDGMTLRDYFASKALQAIIPNPDRDITQDVKLAYEYADAMIKASKV